MANNTAIVLAAGKGTRMGTKVAKQYLSIGGKPVVVHALEAFERAKEIDRIILMTGSGQEEYCRRELVEKYQLQKVSIIREGGRERYETVWKALTALREADRAECTETDYVFIHDGARPFVTEEIISRSYEKVCACKACVVGMPVKDTIKLTDPESRILESPRRDTVWQAQTPQVFSFPLILEAFEKLMANPVEGITDDAMVVESQLHHPVTMVPGSYQNIKITTPEDLKIAETFITL